MSFSLPLKLLAVSAAGLVVSVGLCGFAALARGGHAAAMSAGLAAYAGIAVLALSLLGFITSCVWLVVALIIYLIRN